MVSPSELPGLSLLYLKDGRIVGVNAAAQELLGSQTEFSSKAPWAEWLRLKDPAAAGAWLESETHGRTAHYARTADGGRWLRLRAHSCTSDEAVDRVLNIEDVTEEREAIERDRLEAEHF